MDAPAGTPLWLQIAVPALGILVVPLIRFALQQNKRLDKHEQTLYGEGGTNGLKGDVVKLRAHRHDDAALLQKHEARIYNLEDRMDRADNQK